jgi:hypothetical protein
LLQSWMDPSLRLVLVMMKCLDMKGGDNS